MTPADATSPASRTVAGRVEIAAAVRELVALAQRTLRCAETDLAPFGLSSRATVESLRALLLSRRDARVRLLVDDDGWLEREAARLRRLQWQFPHALELRLAAPDDPVGTDRLVLADDRHLLLLRPGARSTTGRVASNDPAQVRPLADAFDRRWEVAGYNLSTQPLGL